MPVKRCARRIDSIVNQVAQRFLLVTDLVYESIYKRTAATKVCNESLLEIETKDTFVCIDIYISIFCNTVKAAAHWRNSQGKSVY